jgi:DNA invertase Pin-like site-specific DNA recombinase
MSTEHQQYSLVNQQAANEQYAARNGFQIVRTYTDPAKSGLSLKNRAGLKQALNDVMTGPPEFRALLVYDVSRWGRFQDNDESAHYEFICKSSGVPIHYCAETFVNDGSLPSMIIKALKRSMAGEYSRELSVKVYYGLKRLAGLGFKQGGTAGFGLRRVLISPTRELKQVLLPGECKSIHTDRVILIPGPKEELEVIKEIYRMFLKQRLRVGTIASTLNKRGVPYPNGKTKKLWSYASVYSILTHPKYNGCHVFGRTMQRLKTPARRLPREDWVCVPNAFPKVVEDKAFMAAQKRLEQQTHRKSNDQMLDDLRELLKRRGFLTLDLINRSRSTASVSAYIYRFGNLKRAYELIGYCHGDDISKILSSRQRGMALRLNLIRRLHDANPGNLKEVRQNGKWRIRLKLPDNSLLSVVVVPTYRYRNGKPYWKFVPTSRECKNATLLARLNETNTAFVDYTLVRKTPTRQMHLHDNSPLLRSGVCLEDFTKLREHVRAVRERRC